MYMLVLLVLFCKLCVLVFYLLLYIFLSYLYLLYLLILLFFFFFFFQAEDGIRDDLVTGVQTCALPIFVRRALPFEGRQQQDHHDRPDQHPHHVVGRGEREQIHDQQQVVVVRLARRLVVPSHDEPQHQRDGEQRQRVHLFVHDRLIPHRERGGGADRTRQRGEPPRPHGRDPRPHPALAHQEPAPRRDGARHGGEQVDAHRISRGERQQPPSVRDEREQRIARWVGNAERVGGGDVLGRVPELRRRRERHPVQHQRAQADERGHEIGR